MGDSNFHYDTVCVRNDLPSDQLGRKLSLVRGKLLPLFQKTKTGHQRTLTTPLLSRTLAISLYACTM